MGEAEDLVTIPDLMTAPKIAPLPDGLPDARDDGKGTYLPYPLDLEVLRRLRLLYALPDLTQLQMNKQREVVESDCQGRLAVTEAKFLAEREADSPGWSTLEVIGAVAIGVAAGIGIGVGFHALAE